MEISWLSLESLLSIKCPLIVRSAEIHKEQQACSGALSHSPLLAQVHSAARNWLQTAEKS